MDPQKLFQVLVVGGALLGVGCTPESMPEPEPEEDAAVSLDAGSDPADAGEAPADAGATPADAGEPMECGFCPNEVCCETDEEGNSSVREGLVCCWGTSC